MQSKERPKIECGFQIGKLTVSADSGKRKNGYTVWVCNCSCGGTIMLDTRTLQRGTVQDCGCETKVKPGQRDLSGQRFGMLTPISPTEQRDGSGSVIWLCRCDCGKEVHAAASQMTNGLKKSCGCLGNPPLKDFIGQRFGNLCVTGYGGKRAGMHRWECICDCGNTTLVGQTLLQNGKTKSCGCLQAKIVLKNMKYVDGTSVTRLESVGKHLISTNTSGYNGVYYDRENQKWVAKIGFKRKNYHLGSYKNIQDAIDARKKAEERIYGEFLEWYYETYQEK